jgi:hypothetical protein
VRRSIDRTSVVAFAFWLAACGGEMSSSKQAPSDAGTDATAVAEASADASTPPAADASTPPGDDGSPNADTAFLVVLDPTSGCLPQALASGPDGVECAIFEELPGGPCEAMGLGAVDPSVASTVRAHSGASATDTVCALDQIVPAPGESCTASSVPGWCYVTGAAAGNCPQTLGFSPGQPEPEAIVVLGCQ